jgi:molybdate transport system substrate-binding protein
MQGFPSTWRQMSWCRRSLTATLMFGVALAAFPACAQRALHIAAAADLEPVLPAVLQRFEQTTGVHAVASYQSSATLAQQILSGAPFDLFFAANMSYPQRIADAGAAAEPHPTAYARGALVLWARRDARVVQGKALSLGVLRDDSLQSVAIANPAHAPYGRAAQAAIQHMHLSDLLQSKLRVAANIAQAAQYADSGNAEVGFLSLTSAKTTRLQHDGTYVPIPVSDYPPLIQGAVVLKHAADPEDAEKLLHFMAQPATRALLATMGLEPPD